MKAARPAVVGAGIAAALAWVLLSYNDLLLKVPPPTDRVARIMRTGEIRVAVPPDWSPTGPGAPALEWTLINAFAAELGVNVRVQPVPDTGHLEQALAHGEADLGMTGSTLAGLVDLRLRHGPVYRQSQPVVLCPDRRTAGPALRGIRLYAPAGAENGPLRAALERQMPAVRWHAAPEDAETLLSRARHGNGCALMAKSQVEALRVNHPALPDALPLHSTVPAAWLLGNGPDTSLDAKVQAFFDTQDASGELNRLREHHDGPASQFSAADYTHLRAAIRSTLPRYLPTFRAASARSGIPWTLLAALGYQESRWKSDAVSPTGTYGLMMLTKITTEELGLAHPLQDHAAIDAGARYLAYLRRTVAPHAPEPDRTWFAVAAYNVGPAPILRARRLAARAGRSPQRWADVKPYLQRALVGRPATAHRDLVRHVDAVRRYQAALSQVIAAAMDGADPSSPQADTY